MKTLAKGKDHVSTIAKIFCAVFLIGSIVFAFSPNAHDALDLWMKDINHQLYTVVAISSIVTVSWIVWKIKR